MAMPKAAVEHSGFVFWKQNVNRNGTWECTPHPDPLPFEGRGDWHRNSDVKAETKAEFVQGGADAEFRRSIFAPDAGHVPGAVLFCEAVSIQRLKFN
jgi:hypothetical protein